MSAELASGNDEIPVKREISAGAKLELMFEQTGPEVEQSRLQTSLGHAVGNKDAVLASDKVNALIAWFAIVQLDQVISVCTACRRDVFARVRAALVQNVRQMTLGNLYGMAALHHRLCKPVA